MDAGNRAYELVVFDHGSVVTSRLPQSGAVRVGRAADCDVRIDHPSVSRHHALIQVGERVTVEDLGSANGTFRRTPENPREVTSRVSECRLEPRCPVPLEPQEALYVGSVVLVLRERSASVPAAVGRPSSSPSRHAVIVRDEAMKRLYALAERVAQSPVSVLLLGETGVGKEILAEAIHEGSPRAQAPFIRLNNAALPETLLESTLFGHERGAIPGVTHASPGLLEAADGGTLFLDEVGEMPTAIQAKLLRVLEDRVVARVGGGAPKTVDVRFVAATHRDLEADVAKGRFRADLYFRLNGFSLSIPPLRERTTEISELAQAFIARAAAESGRPVPVLLPEARAMLEQHPWPGNVRELRSVVERAMVLCEGDSLGPQEVVFDRRSSRPPPPPETPPEEGDLPSNLRAVERERIVDALARCNGNQTQAAALLGIPRRTLVARIAEYGLLRPRSK